MGRIIGKTKHTRRPGQLLYVDSGGYVAEAKMSRGRKKKRRKR
jgi:hypothetical protein